MRRFLGATVAGVASAMLLGSLGAQTGPPAEIAAPARVFYGLTPQFAAAPDARNVVFVADAPEGPAMLWLRPLPSGAARPLAGTAQASYPFWSADSRYIGFFAAGKLQKVAAAGGSPIVVCDAPNGRGGTWSANDLIVFTSGISDPLRKVAASGGQPTSASVLDTSRENSHRFPQFLPDGRHVLYWAGAGSAPPTLKIGNLDSTETVAVAAADTQGAYAAGFVFYGKGNALMAQAIDAATFQKTGDPVRVGEPLSGDAGSSFGSFSVAADGTVLYTRGAPRPFVLTWFDRSGAVLARVGEPGLYTNVALSPDDKRIAVSLTAGTPANRDIWILDASTGAATRLTNHPAVDASPVWSPDGTKVAFSSQRDGPYQIYVQDVGGAAATPLFKGNTAVIATDWLRDGKSVAYTQGPQVSLWPLSDGGNGRPLVNGPGARDNAVGSPSGAFVAFQANESGRNEIYAVSSAPGSMRVIQVSSTGGTQPLWRGDGQEIFYFAPDGSVMTHAVVAADGGTLRLAIEPRKLFSAPMSLVIRRSYAVTSDGQRILMPILDDRIPQTIAVVPRWTASRSR